MSGLSYSDSQTSTDIGCGFGFKPGASPSQLSTSLRENGVIVQCACVSTTGDQSTDIG